MERKILLLASVVGIAVVAIIAAFVFSLVLLEQDLCIKPGGRIVSKNISLGNFTELEVTGPVEVFFTQSETESVQIEATENIIGLVNAVVEGNTLKLFFTEMPLGAGQICSDFSNAKILISAPELENITASNSAKVFVEEQLLSEILSVKAANSALVEVNVYTGVLTSFASNSAAIVLKGFAEDHLAKAVSGGRILASELLTRTAVLEAEDAGVIDATILDEVELSAISGGSVGFRGRPMIISSSTSSGGTITEIISDDAAGDDAAGDADADAGDDVAGDGDDGDNAEDDKPEEEVVCGDGLVTGSEECEFDNDCLEWQVCVQCSCVTVFNPESNSLTGIGCLIQGGFPECGESPECSVGVKNVGTVENPEQNCVCCVSH